MPKYVSRMRTGSTAPNLPAPNTLPPALAPTVFDQEGRVVPATPAAPLTQATGTNRIISSTDVKMDAATGEVYMSSGTIRPQERLAQHRPTNAPAIQGPVAPPGNPAAPVGLIPILDRTQQVAPQPNVVHTPFGRIRPGNAHDQTVGTAGIGEAQSMDEAARLIAAEMNRRLRINLPVPTSYENLQQILAQRGLPMPAFIRNDTLEGVHQRMQPQLRGQRNPATALPGAPRALPGPDIPEMD